MTTEEQKKLTGQRIKALREEADISQDQLAKLLGYKSASSRTTINKVELGINDIAQSKLQKYAAALSTTVEYLIGLSDVPHINSITDNHGVIGTNNGSVNIGYQKNLTEQEKDLLRIYNGLNGRQQLTLMSYAYELEEKKNKSSI